MALVCRRKKRRESNLLAPVGGADVDLLVVNPDPIHAVSGGNGDLHAGGDGEGRGGGDIEDVDGGVLEDEAGLGGAEDGPHEEDDEEDDENEGGNGVEYEADELEMLLVVMAAVLGTHILE